MALDQKTREADRVYEEFEPPIDWDHDEGSDTLILMLPGFKKEQLRVQVTSTRLLRVSGERQISENKWRRFRKEMAMPSHSDTSGISAKFEAGMLYVRLPKMIITNNNNSKQQQQQQSPTNNAPTPAVPPTKPTQPAAAAATTTTPTPTPKQEDPNEPEPAHRVGPRAHVVNQRKPRVLGDKLGADQYSNKSTDDEGQKPKPEEPIKELHDEKHSSSQKKPEPPQKVEKGKARILTDDDINKGTDKVEGAAAILKHGSGGGSDHDHGKVLEKRSLTMEMVSRQSQEYMNAVSRLVEEVKQQKKLVKVLLLTLLVLLLGVYVKNAIKSSF